MTEVDDVSAVVSEVNFIGSNTKEWWVDTGAIHHVIRTPSTCEETRDRIRSDEPL